MNDAQGGGHDLVVVDLGSAHAVDGVRPTTGSELGAECSCGWRTTQSSARAIRRAHERHVRKVMGGQPDRGGGDPPDAPRAVLRSRTAAEGRR